MQGKKWTLRRVIKLSLKVAGWIAGSVVGLLLLLILVIRVPSVQQKIVNKATSWLQAKIGTEVSISSLYVSFPKQIVIRDLFLADQHGDTLFYLGEGIISTDLWGLVHDKIQLNQVALDNLVANVSKQDSAFNFSYIVTSFQSPASQATSPDTTKGWEFVLGDVALTRVRAKYDDAKGGDHAAAQFHQMNIPIDKFNLDSMEFIAGAVELTEAKIAFTQSASIVQNAKSSLPETTQGELPVFGFTSLLLNKVQINYDQKAAQSIDAKIGHLKIVTDHFDLARQILAFREVTIQNSMVDVRQMTQPVATTKDVTGGGLTWNLQVEKINLADNTVQYYDFSAKTDQLHFDPSHVWLRQLTLEAKNIKVSGDDYSATISHTSFADHSGLTLREFKGNFHLTSKGALVNDMELSTNTTHLVLAANASFTSFASLAQTWEQISFTADISPSVVGLADVKLLVPSLPMVKGLSPTAQLHLTGHFSGTPSNLNVQAMRASALTHTHIALAGNIKGLPDFSKTQFHFRIDSMGTTRADANPFLTDSIRSSLEVPVWVSASGIIKGRLRQPAGDMVIRTSDGSAKISGNADLDSASVGAYHLSASTDRLAIGSILRQPQVGPITIESKLDGSGMSLAELNARIHLHVTEAEFNGYTYRGLLVDGISDHFLFDGSAVMHDPNLSFEITGKADYKASDHHYELKAQLLTADFKALHLSDRPMKARGTLVTKLTTPDFKTINGYASIRQVAIFNGQNLYKSDSMLYLSIKTKKETQIDITSEIVSGYFKGSIDLPSLPSVLKAHFNHYFSVDTNELHEKTSQNFDFKLELHHSNLITDIFLPELKSFETSPVTGVFDSNSEKLELHAEIRKLRYANLSFQELGLDVASSAKKLTSALSIDDLKYDSLRIPGMKLSTIVSNDSIRASLTILDSLSKVKYQIGSVFNSLKDEYQFRLVPGEVLLNYDKWDVPETNFLRFAKEEMRAKDFSIAHGSEKIMLETAGAKDSIVSVGFRQLDLDNLFNIVSGSRSIVDGRADGDLQIFVKKNNAFKASLTIDSLKIMGGDWGKFHLTADRLTADKFTVGLTVKGEKSDITLKGDYIAAKPASQMNVDATIVKLGISLIEPFSAGQLKKSSGSIEGALKIKGTLDLPSIEGDVNFKDVSFVSSYVNSTFHLKSETLKFQGSQLGLTNFKVLDEENNAAIFNGTVQTKDFRDYDMNLTLTTKNFRILNTTAKNNSLYFGKVKMNATAKVTGPLTLPVVDLHMAFSDDTQFNYVVPASSKGVIDRKGIVEFISKRPSRDTFLTSLKLKDTVENVIRGLSLTATVQLEDAQKVSIIIDPRTGDKLTLQGSTNLLIKIDPSGNMDLSGQYEISKGSYSFSFYKLVHRDFEILKGSTVTWAGDPMDATFNIQALYKVETSPLELLANQSTDVNQYRQSFPFLVYLTIRGEISAPEITFKLDMPESDKGALGGNIYAAIQDINTREPDLNKQVFSLLVLRRFMADDPFENQATTSLASNARSSVSGLLTDQLNKLSSNVKGVQLSVDLKSFDDYTTGTPSNQTQLQLGVSKTLLHDKLVVKLAGNVDIAGENTSQNSLTDYIGDLALEYKLTSDGRLRLTGFRNSDFDMIDGELIKTGAGLIYIKDYNAFKELFKANEKAK